MTSPSESKYEPKARSLLNFIARNQSQPVQALIAQIVCVLRLACDEARAEGIASVNALIEVMDQGSIKKEAYEKGAAEMRERAAKLVESTTGTCLSFAKAIRALPTEGK